MHDIVEFLRQYPPFDDLDEEALDELSASTEVEYFTAGTTIFAQSADPLDHAFMVRRGMVELVDRGEVIDQLGEGELFGHPSMLAGRPTEFEACAGEDTLCYRMPAEVVTPLLTRPAGLRFVTRTLLSRLKPDPAQFPANIDPAQQPAASLVRQKPLICDPGDSLRTVARQMNEAGASSALIRLGEGTFGVLTDHDLRFKVVADGISVDAPVSKVMTAPAFTVGPDQLGAEIMLEMLDRGVRHVPVVSPLGDALGVLTDMDLLAARTGTPFVLRRAISEADDFDGVKRAARRLRPTVVDLHDARMAPMQIAGIISVVADALTRRLLELTIEELGPPPRAFTWLALGSLGRREAVPSSDIDSAIVWADGGEGGGGGSGEPEDYMQRLGARVVAGLGETGFSPDTHGVTADKPLFERSYEGWRSLIRRSIEEPSDVRAMVLSLLLDARPVFERGDIRDPLEELQHGRHRRGLSRLMLTLALAHKPPSGFLRLRHSPRDFVVESSGEHRGRLDIKHGGLLPINSIARYAGLATGARTTSTAERLRIAGTAGTIEGHEARTLEEAYSLFWGLRLEHQVEQIRNGGEPDDYIDPELLNPLTRRYLRDAFNAVRGVQRALSNELRFA